MAAGNTILTAVYLVLFLMTSWIEDSIWVGGILLPEPLYAFC